MRRHGRNIVREENESLKEVLCMLFGVLKKYTHRKAAIEGQGKPTSSQHVNVKICSACHAAWQEDGKGRDV